MVWFYLASLLLGFGLFHGWPHVYVWAGRGLAESMLLTVATINLHHFIVDAYIWRLRKDPNRTVMMEARPAAAA